MLALSPAVRPFAGGVPRRAATAPSDASERASSEKKLPRVVVAPARASSACLNKMTRNRNHNSVVPAGGEKSFQELLQKRQASELDAVRGLLKKAELTSRRGASKGGAPIADDKKEQFLAPKQRPKPTEDAGGNAPSVKRRKVSSPVEQQKFAEESKDDNKVAEESKGEVVLEQESKGGDTGKIIISTSAQQSSEAASATAQSTAEAESVSGEDNGVPVYYIRPNKPVFVRPEIDMAGLIQKAKLRRRQLEMEKAAQRDQSFHPRNLQRLGIAEYGRPRVPA